MPYRRTAPADILNLQCDPLPADGAPPFSHGRGASFPEKIHHAVAAQLERLRLPADLNENAVDRLLKFLETGGDPHHPIYWLLLARLTEAALVCAGNYADNCEFAAAGDLLVNPRQIFLHLDSGNRHIPKKRHQRVSRHFPEGPTFSAPGFRRRIEIETAKPPLLPYLQERLQFSVFIAPWYPPTVSRRMQRIADAIGFLSAGGLTTPEALHQHLRSVALPERQLIQGSLCGFDTAFFERLGEDLKQMFQQPERKSEFLSGAKNLEKGQGHQKL